MTIPHVLRPLLFVLLVSLFSSTLSGNAIAQSTVPGEIVFLKPEPLTLPFGGKLLIKVQVFSKQGSLLHGIPVKWKLAKPDDANFVYIGTVVNDAQTKTNSVELVWRPGPPGLRPPSEVQLAAIAGDAVTIETIKYESANIATDALITFSEKELEIQPGSTQTVKVTVRARKDERILEEPNIKAELADPTMDKLVKVIGPDKDNVITIVGLYGDPAKPVPFLKSALVVRTPHVTQTLPLTYVGEPVSTEWSLIPSEICGDNFGRTIKTNYFCVEVTIQNYSGSDIALAGLVFERTFDDKKVFFPVSSYSTVRGSLAKRKLTHPRTLSLAIVDAVGSLMTGFVPFFHNDAHKANYSTFIDIISNPLAKGLALAWKDAYPDEVTRFEANVLKDDKNIAKGERFRTTVFYPKRLLFADKDNDRDDPTKVRKKLGSLIVLGYKFERGPLRRL